MKLRLAITLAAVLSTPLPAHAAGPSEESAPRRSLLEALLGPDTEAGEAERRRRAVIPLGEGWSLGLRPSDPTEEARARSRTIQRGPNPVPGGPRESGFGLHLRF